MSTAISENINKISACIQVRKACTLGQIALHTGLRSQALTDAVYKMEQLGIISGKADQDGVVTYRNAIGSTQAPDGEPTKKDRLLAYFLQNPQRSHSLAELEAALPEAGSLKNVLTQLKRERHIINVSRGRWILEPDKTPQPPAQPETKAAPPKETKAEPPKPEPPGAPALPTAANTGDKPFYKQETAIGCFNDGTIEIKRGTTVMRFTKPQIIEAMEFINRFLSILPEAEQ